jgi:hypothetical protein
MGQPTTIVSEILDSVKISPDDILVTQTTFYKMLDAGIVEVEMNEENFTDVIQSLPCVLFYKAQIPMGIAYLMSRESMEEEFNIWYNFGLITTLMEQE